SPFTTILPTVGSTSRNRQRTRVDFPLPDKPMITNISPGWTSKETSRTATTIPGIRWLSSRRKSVTSMRMPLGANTFQRLRTTSMAMAASLRSQRLLHPLGHRLGNPLRPYLQVLPQEPEGRLFRGPAVRLHLPQHLVVLLQRRL